jgi:hypothetical protein
MNAKCSRLEKTIAASILAALALLPVCRKSDPYAEVRDLLTQSSARLEMFAARMEKVQDAAAAAEAMTALTAAMLETAPQIKALGSKYPELSNPAALPETLRPLLAGLDAANARMTAGMQKAMVWGDDPAVQAAKAGLARVEAGLR